MSRWEIWLFVWILLYTHTGVCVCVCVRGVCKTWSCFVLITLGARWSVFQQVGFKVGQIFSLTLRLTAGGLMSRTMNHQL